MRYSYTETYIWYDSPFECEIQALTLDAHTNRHWTILSLYLLSPWMHAAVSIVGWLRGVSKWRNSVTNIFICINSVFRGSRHFIHPAYGIGGVSPSGPQSNSISHSDSPWTSALHPPEKIFHNSKLSRHLIMAERQGRLLPPMFALSIYYYTEDTTRGWIYLNGNIM